MSKIMELSDAYAMFRQSVGIYGPSSTEARAALAAEVERMEAEIAALREDAERHRWMRDEAGLQELEKLLVYCGNDFDGAVDSARGIK